MIKAVIIILAAVIPVSPVVVYFWSMRGHDRIKGTKDLIFAFKSFNAVLVLMGLGLAVAWLVSPQTVFAATGLLQQAVTDPYASLAAGVSTGLAALGAGVAVSGTGEFNGRVQGKLKAPSLSGHLRVESVKMHEEEVGTLEGVT